MATICDKDKCSNPAVLMTVSMFPYDGKTPQVKIGADLCKDHQQVLVKVIDGVLDDFLAGKIGLAPTMPI